MKNLRRRGREPVKNKERVGGETDLRETEKIRHKQKPIEGLIPELVCKVVNPLYFANSIFKTVPTVYFLSPTSCLRQPLLPAPPHLFS